MSLVRVKSQFCPGIAQYDRCSLNSACACFHIAGAIDVGICTDEFIDCSELVPCERSNNLCHEPNHRCVHHPRYNNLPVCYSVPSFNRQLCPPITSKKTNSDLQIQVKAESFLKLFLHRSHTLTDVTHFGIEAMGKSRRAFQKTKEMKPDREKTHCNLLEKIFYRFY